MSLTQAIDEAVAYVRAHENPDRMTPAEIDEFRQLAERVYLLAYRAGLHDALPKVPELQPQLASNDLPPVQFETKLNLPGDWSVVQTDDDDAPLMPSYPMSGDLPEYEPPERVFIVCATPRWFHDMDVLRVLALADKTEGTKPHGDKTPPGVSHSDDSRSVHWYGIEYVFTPTQAACVRVLWDAWERGGARPWPRLHS